MVPCWIPDEFDIRLVDAVDGHDLGLGVRCDHRAHAAAGCGQGHFHLHDFPLADLVDRAVIDEAEVDDVHGDFWIVNAFQLCPDLLFQRRVLEPHGLSVLLLFLLGIHPQRVGIL